MQGTIRIDPLDPSLENDTLLKEWSNGLQYRSQKLRQLKYKERENTYVVRIGTGAGTNIPTYEAEDDVNCPIARARVFNRLQKEALAKGPFANRPSSALLTPSPLQGEEEEVVIPFRGKAGLPVYTLQAGEGDGGGRKNTRSSSSAPVIVSLGNNFNNAAASKATNHHRHGHAAAATTTTTTTTTRDEGDCSAVELDIRKQVMVRDALVRELRVLINETNDKSVISTGVVSHVRAVECLRLLQRIRKETLDILEAIRRWRRTTFDPTRAFLFPDKQNYLLYLITDLDFVDNHDRVVALLQHRMRQNPLIAYDSLLCPNPYASAEQEAERQAKPNPLNTISATNLLKIKECETMLLQECKRRGYTLRLPSPRLMLQLANAPLSCLIPDKEVQSISKELNGYVQKIMQLQTSIEEQDNNILELQRLIRPLKRQVGPITEKIATIKRKIMFAAMNHNDRKVLRFKTTLRFWEMELENLKLQIKAKNADVFLRKMEISRRHFQIDNLQLELKTRKKRTKHHMELKVLYDDRRQYHSAQNIQKHGRGYIARKRVNKLKQHKEEAQAAAGIEQEAFQEAPSMQQSQQQDEDQGKGEQQQSTAEQEREKKPPTCDVEVQTDPVIVVPICKIQIAAAQEEKKLMDTREVLPIERKHEEVAAGKSVITPFVEEIHEADDAVAATQRHQSWKEQPEIFPD